MAGLARHEPVNYLPFFAYKTAIERIMAEEYLKMNN
jgi:hypothetical protein